MIKLTYLVLALGLALLVQPAEAQRTKRASPRAQSAQKRFMQNSPFFNQQWWIGVKGGLTASQAQATERYTVFTPTEPGQSLNNFSKTYQGFMFSQPATSLGVIGAYSFWRGLALVLQPTYYRYTFHYNNVYQWQDGEQALLKIEQRHQLALSYLEVPLLLRYDLGSGRWRPRLQAGAFYGHLLKAEKMQEVTSTDLASGAQNPIESLAPSMGAQHLFTPTQLGWLAGGGCSYMVGNLRLGLDVTYRQGLNNITNRRSRYQDQRLIGNGDILDDMELQSWEAAFSLVFPLKFLDTGAFKPAQP